MKDIRYVQLEPAAFLTDVDFQMMDAEQRGVYCSIIFYLYANGGELELDNSEITLLSDGSNKLAAISNCYKTGPEWKRLWGKIAHKFQINGKILTHKRVIKELKKAKNLKEAKSKGGKKGMETRWADKTLITNETKRNVTKRKGNLNTTYTNTNFLSKSAFVRFADDLEKILKPRTKSDRMALLNLIHWLMEEFEQQRQNESVFDKVLIIARDAQKGKKPWGLFFSLLDNEIGYRAKSSGK